MSLIAGDGPGPLPDSRGEAVAWFLLVPTLVVLGTLLYVQANPGTPWQLDALYSTTLSVADDPVTSNDTLHLSQVDAAYMNRVYRELDGYTETGYCIHRVHDEIRISKAATLEATESSVRFSTANCRFVDGIVHTHPPWSHPVLSGPETSVDEDWNDKEAFLASDHEISCVQAGLMTEDVGERTGAFRCYLRPDSGDVDDEFPEIAVVITDE